MGEVHAVNDRNVSARKHQTNTMKAGFGFNGASFSLSLPRDRPLTFINHFGLRFLSPGKPAPKFNFGSKLVKARRGTPALCEVAGFPLL